MYIKKKTFAFARSNQSNAQEQTERHVCGLSSKPVLQCQMQIHIQIQIQIYMHFYLYINLYIWP